MKNNFLRKMVLMFSVGLIVVGLTGCSFMQNDEQQTKIDNLEKQIDELNDRLEDETSDDEDEDVEDEGDEDEEGDENSDDDAMVPEVDEDDDSDSDDEDETVSKPVSNYTGESFITLKSPENGTYFYDEPVRFSGYLSPDTVKITVKATTPASPNVDDYTLQQYKSGSTSFSYGAKREWNNLSEGSNTYVFTAYFEDGTSKSTSTTITFIFGDAGKGG